MEKRVKVILLVFFSFICCAFADNEINFYHKNKLYFYVNNENSLMLIKPLNETISYNIEVEKSDFFQKATKSHIKEFASARNKKLNKLVAFYKIKNPMAIIESGSIFFQTYSLKVLTKETIYYLKLNYNSEIFGSFSIDNESITKKIKNNLEKLVNFKGEVGLRSTNSSILFITYYKNNLPQKTLVTDFPRISHYVKLKKMPAGAHKSKKRILIERMYKENKPSIDAINLDSLLKSIRSIVNLNLSMLDQNRRSL